MKCTAKLLTLSIVAMMVFGGLVVMIDGAEETDAAFTNSFNVQPGKTFDSGDLVPGGSDVSGNTRVVSTENMPSWASITTSSVRFKVILSPAVNTQGEYSFKATIRTNFGTYVHNFNVTIQPYNVKYVLQGETNHQTYGSTILYSPEVRDNYQLRWYTASTGGSQIGNAGQTVTITDNTTLYGRWEQTKVIFNPNVLAADVYVHYRDFVEYNVGTMPTGCTITAKWNSTAVTLPIIVSGSTVRVNSINLESGVYAMTITAGKTGMNPSSMTLYVHVYPHEVKDLEPYGLSTWSYIVPTYNALDTMELVSATKTVAGITSSVSGSAITISTNNRTIGYTFSEEGIYEFTLRLKSPAGDRCTTILRINATETIISATPMCDGISAIKNADRIVDFTLQNPQNFVSVIWSYGDGATEQNVNTTRAHAYNSPNIYTAKATLTNSLGATVTVTAIVDLMEESKPTSAYRNGQYTAVVKFNGLLTPESIPSWLTFSIVNSGSVNYAVITGSFSDVLLVGSKADISLNPSIGQPIKWTIDLKAAVTDALIADFEYEIVGNVVKVWYTGTIDGATTVYVQWADGTGQALFLPTSDGKMAHTYSNGIYILRMFAIRDGISNEAAVEIRIIGASSGAGQGNGNNDDGDDGDDESPEKDYSLLIVVVLAITILGVGFCVATGHFRIAIVVIAASAIFIKIFGGF